MRRTLALAFILAPPLWPQLDAQDRAAPSEAAAGPAGWRQRQLIITFWCPPPATDEALAAVAAEGYNLTWVPAEGLDAAARHGLRAMLTSDLLSPAALDDPARRPQLDALVARVKTHPALEAYFITDEPGAGAFPGLGKLVAYLRERDPAHLAYINLFPTYASEAQLGVSADAAERAKVGYPQNFAGVGTDVNRSYAEAAEAELKVAIAGRWLHEFDRKTGRWSEGPPLGADRTVKVQLAPGDGRLYRVAGEPAARPPHLVSRIDVKDFGAETVRIGDLSDDGAPDLLFVQSVYATREITCLTAARISGEVLWQSGKPSSENGTIYSDLPVQVYDWDSDGRNEVLYVRQARYAEPPHDGKRPRERADRYEGDAAMVILDGITGREEGTFPLPAPADDSFLFADLTGRGRREDLVVKDRYWNAWGVSHEGKVLWHWPGSVGHFPAIADVDGDSRDEVFFGFALIDHDGKPIFEKDPRGAHQDACWILRAADGKPRILFGNSGIHCLAPDGTVFWEHPLGEAQHVVAGRFRAEGEVQLAVVDRTPVPTHRRDADAWAILYLYDLDGKELWRRQQRKGDWAIATVPLKWSGGPLDAILVYGQGEGRPAVIYDGAGDVVAVLPMEHDAERPDADRKAGFYALAADVWGDSRDEVILFGSRGACIYANPSLLEVPTLYNETLYPGM